MHFCERACARVSNEIMKNAGKADLTVQQVFGELPARLNADVTRGMNAVIQFDISGDGGGNYNATIKDGGCIVRQGTHPRPNVTLTLAAQDYVDIMTGKASAEMLFMGGKLEIAGYMGLALKLHSLFKRVGT